MTSYGLTAFNSHHERYEAWFTFHEAAYLSEGIWKRGLCRCFSNDIFIVVKSPR